jgi:multicomponent Na+:H+ antiporter subunit E
MSFVLTWVILAAFWIALSGVFEPMALGLGFVGVTFSAWVGHRLLFPDLRAGVAAARFGRFVAYLPWFAWQLVLSNWDLVKRSLGPEVNVAPSIVRFKTSLKTDVARTTLANSITLTPGTLTLAIEGDEYVIHCISPEAAASMVDGGDMEKRVRIIEGA